MFMVIKEDIENLIFKCEKLIDANTLKAKRNKKEVRTLKKVIENYEVSEDNKIVYTEITNRYNDLVSEQEIIKQENKWLKDVLRKLKLLIVTEYYEEVVPVETVYREITPVESLTDNIAYEVDQE